MAPSTTPTSAAKVSSAKFASARKSSPAGHKGGSGGSSEDDGEDNHGFYGNSPCRKQQKMSWTEQADIDLLLFGLDRKIKSSEHEAIAASFSEKPTAKAVQERLAKLRAEQMVLLKDLGVFDIDAQQNVAKKGGKGKGKKVKDAEEDRVEEEEETEEYEDGGEDVRIRANANGEGNG